MPAFRTAGQRPNLPGAAPARLAGVEGEGVVARALNARPETAAGKRKRQPSGADALNGDLDRVRLHADLTILAKLASALARKRVQYLAA